MVILQDVEMLGKKMGFITENKNFHNISLGQGQEVGWPNLYNHTTQLILHKPQQQKKEQHTYNTIENIARSRIAASNTSHQL